MSFDVFLQRFEGGEAVQVDPRPVLAVLRGFTYRGPDEFGFYVVAFPDEVEVEFSAKGLESDGPLDGCAFHIQAFGDPLMNFILEIARAGDMVIVPAMDGNLLILVSEAQISEVPADLRHDSQAVVASSAAELGAVLSGGLAAWSAYREHVLRQSAPETA
jgi:hypothetical protein